MRALLIVIGVVALAVAVDRLMLAAERRGWVYWRRRKPSSGARSAAAGALGELNALATPSYRYVVEQRRHEEARPEATESGEDP